MTIEGRLFVANRMTEIKEVTTEDTDSSYSKRLEKALVELCRQMDIPVPMWMKKNTREFAAFGQTIFFREQYTENVRFDRFQIRVIRLMKKRRDRDNRRRCSRLFAAVC